MIPEITEMGLRERRRAAREMVEVLRELGLDRSCPRLLDLACAEVRPYSRECLRAAGRYVGLDPDLHAMAHSGPEVRDNLRASLVRGVGERLPFADGSFDAVVINCALAYCNKRATVAECGRVLKLGGHLLCLRNSGLGYSLARMKSPRQRWWAEWLHSLVVIANTFVYRLGGARLFRTTYSTESELVRLVEEGPLDLVRSWICVACEGYRQSNFIARKPQRSGG